MQKQILAAIAGSACLLAATGAFANEPKDNGVSAEPFATLDRNRDNRISRSEAGFDRTMSKTFAELDTDADGFVSSAEFAAGEESRTAVSKLTPQ